MNNTHTCKQRERERERGALTTKRKEVYHGVGSPAEAEAADGVDGSRISPKRMWVCSRLPAASGGDSRRDETCHGAREEVWWRACAVHGPELPRAARSVQAGGGTGLGFEGG